MIRIIDALSDVSQYYNWLLVDIWGCLHNGVAAFPQAVRALCAFRENNGKVILLTNSPKCRSDIIQQLNGLAISAECWDTIVTSGDASRYSIASGDWGRFVYHIGPESDRAVFTICTGESSSQQKQGTLPRLVDFDQATVLACTGPYNDEVDTLGDYSDLLAQAIKRNMKMLCMNPDIVVDRGNKRVLCAGALAQYYSQLGGHSVYFGKPHQPIYDLAYQRMRDVQSHDSGALSLPLQCTQHNQTPVTPVTPVTSPPLLPVIGKDTILAIGDGIRTDILGAYQQGIDSVFISGGLACAETATRLHPDREKLTRFLHDAGVFPSYTLGFLR